MKDKILCEKKSKKKNDAAIDSRFPFRKGSVKTPTEAQLKKVSKRRLSSFNVLYCYAILPFRKQSAWAVWSYIGVVASKFFMPQYLRKLNILRTPILHVDNDLDDVIPFDVSHVHCYMDFINFWIRPLAMLLHRFGNKDGSILAAEFLRYIKLLYKESYRVYRVYMTTTERPKTDNKSLKRIHRIDPHDMCVPSLHVSIVTLCFSFYRMLFERENFTESEKSRWNRELYDHAVEIAETVLYIKQHSVNCIPAALYMVTKLVPELFSPEDAVDFINRLFVNDTSIDSKKREDVIAYIQFIYERFLLEGIMENDWTVPVLNWLKNYKPYIRPQK